MANLEVIALDTVTPQLRAPGAGDTYLFPRQAAFTNNVGVGTTTPGTKLEVSYPNQNLTGNTSGDSKVHAAFMTNDEQNVDVGGAIGFGGQYISGNTNKVLFGVITGRKENGTSTLTSGYLAFSTTLGGSGSVERLRITSTGNVGIGTTTPTAVLQLKSGTATANNAPLKFTSGTNLTTPEAGAFEYNGTDLFFTRSGTTRETVITSAAGVTQLSTFDAVSPIAQTLQSQGSRTGTDSNVAGASLTIRPGKGTGNATPGPLIFQSYVAVASGSGAQTTATTLTLNNGVPVFPSFKVAGLPPAATAGAGARVFVTDSLVSTTIGIGTIVANGGANFVPVYSDGANWKIG